MSGVVGCARKSTISVRTHGSASTKRLSLLVLRILVFLRLFRFRNYSFDNNNNYIIKGFKSTQKGEEKPRRKRR